MLADHSHLSDLLAKCCDGDQAAWETFQKTYCPHICFVVRSVLTSRAGARLKLEDVQDIAQDAPTILTASTWMADAKRDSTSSRSALASA